MVMIPTYNESENIILLLDKIFSLKIPNLYTLVVDDNSPDRTWDLVKKYGKKNKRALLLHRTRNKGRGLAGIAGFKYCLENGADIIIEMDADFSHPPEKIPELLQKLKHYDVVLGSRFIKGGKDLDRGALRQAITTFARLYIKTLLNTRIKDVTSGYRCYRRRVLEAINLDRFISKGPEIVQEVLYTAHIKGFRIGEVPIVFVDRTRGESNLNIKNLMDGMLMIWRIWIRKK